MEALTAQANIFQVSLPDSNNTVHFFPLKFPMWLGIEIIIAFTEDIQKEDNYQKNGILFEYIFNVIFMLSLAHSSI